MELDQTTQIMKNDLLTRAKILGFHNLNYDTQWIIFNKARMFGWEGERPNLLGTQESESVLESVIDFLIKQGVCFRRAI